MTQKIADTASAWVHIKQNWVLQIVQKFVFAFTLISLVLLGFFWSKLPPLVPLWYSKPWGVEQLSNPIFLLILPIGSGVFYLINFIIGKYITNEYLIFTQALFITSFIVSVLSLLTLLKIILLII